MSHKLLRLTRFIAPSHPATPVISTQFQHRYRTFATSRTWSAIVDSHFISQITAAEKTITKQDEPVKDGPTAQAQSHVGQELTAQVVHDITVGEKVITGQDQPVQRGPTSVAQSILAAGSPSGGRSASTFYANSNASGVLDSEIISKITEKEKNLTGEKGPAAGGPTARAQQHAGEPITSQALHDITEGEKKVAGGERVKGGPTSTAQSELAKSRA